MKSRPEINKLLFALIERTSADSATAHYYYKKQQATRFGENAITQNLAGDKEKITLSVAFGHQHGSASTTNLSDESLSHLITQAENNANLSPPDPEYMLPAEKQEYPKTGQRFFKNVADFTPDQLANDVATSIKLAQANQLTCSGLYETNVGIDAIANSNQLFAYDIWSQIQYSLTINGENGTGANTVARHNCTEMDVENIVQQAIQTALNAQHPQSIQPKKYRVILEPQAVLDLLDFFVWSMGARSADEGSSPFSNLVGEQLFANNVSLYTITDSPLIAAKPFGEAGIATRPQTWIKDGVLTRLYHDRFWASQKGEIADPTISPLYMPGENQSIDDLVHQCMDGVLVKRLWYIRFVDQHDCLLTGMTRDGFFRIKNGKITGPIKNLRFNDSPLTFLSQVEAMSQPENVANRALLPAIMSHSFNFTSTTESI